jgi:hypothetical protein
MDVARTTTIDVLLSTAEVIRALKAYFTHDLNIQALPIGSSNARGVRLVLETPGAGGLHITFTNLTGVPVPEPIINDSIEHDPA